MSRTDRRTPTILVVQGSDRHHGDTSSLVAATFSDHIIVDIRLAALRIAHYRYEEREGHDDFLAVVTAMVDAQAIIFATPVYWYAMSGRMKVLFDRFTDLLDTPLGRQLAARKVFLLACGTEPALPEGFEVPFAMTAAYFSMKFVAS